MIIDLVGIPWEQGGRSRDGADCLGLVLLAQMELGRKAVDPADQIGDTDYLEPGTLVRGWDRIDPGDELQLGDLLEQSWHDGDERTHCSVVAESGWVLCTDRAAGSFLAPIAKVLRTSNTPTVWRPKA